ncbi:MATE family efflux transporter [Canibacter oris]|uniref:Putative MATE family efflux protein n=1 Tax=Canibacter oris TaxID=1365628 RepID=A0A840DHF9_9MICO|nr:MATE family efflux transporter [Canibacter oris]MBB4072170.1 putative MATE family efflux protein [Canibacter oris]
MPEAAAPGGNSGVTAQILRLAVPAFGALIAQPLLVLVDTAMLGHLGVAELAGATIAATLITTTVGLMVFLAYSATSKIARLYGAGKPREALQAGLDATALAALIGCGAVLLLGTSGNWLLSLFTALNSETGIFAAEYFFTALWGVPAMLLCYAFAGTERGLQNTVTPLIVTVFGATVNAALNWIFMFHLGLGVFGSALGTTLAEWLMALLFCAKLYSRSRILNFSWQISLAGIASSVSSGSWLFLRTLSLRIAILLTMWAATVHSPTVTASLAVINAVFMLLSYALDALAIAAQALIGKAFGAGDTAQVRQLTRQLLRLAATLGAALGLLLALSSGVLPQLFGAGTNLNATLTPALLVLALAQPLCGAVFALDGVLIGAGDHRYLALTGVLNLLCFAPPLLILASAATKLSPQLYLGFLVAAFMLLYMASRFTTLFWRSSGATLSFFR